MLDAVATTIRRIRSVPATATILTSPGEAVMPGTPVARAEIAPGRLRRVDVAGNLKIDRAATPVRLIVQPGERVSEGSIVATGGTFFSRRATRSPASGVIALVSKTRGFAYVREDVETGSQEGPVEIPVAKMLGIPPLAVMVYKASNASVGMTAVKGQPLARFGKSVVESPIYGRITEIAPTKGTITISPLFRPQVVSAYLRGTVERVIPGEGVEVSGKAWVVSGIWGLGGESHGTLHVIDGDLTAGAVLPEVAVVAARGTATYEGLLRCAESGVKGVILGWLGSATAMRFAGGVKNMGVTGDEEIPFPLVLIQGFLRQVMREDVFGVLAGSEGLLCSMNGATHIRAGVVRPEILIFPE